MAARRRNLGDLNALSPAERLALLEPEERAEILALYSAKTAEELLHLWEFHARPKQLPPAGPWLIWLILAGRGFGKTRTGAETVRGWAESGKVQYITLAGPTSDDIRIAMIEGESGLLSVASPDHRIDYQPSRRRISWPRTGCVAQLISADEPDRFRNKQHEKIWADELAAWKYPEAYDMMMFGLRLGTPQLVATTTPRPIPLIKKLVKAAAAAVARGDKSPRVVVTRGSSYENRNNLATQYIESVIEPYEGTELGRQEIEAEVLDDTKGALWTQERIDALRVAENDVLNKTPGESLFEQKAGVPLAHRSDKKKRDTIEQPQLIRVVVGVDPSVAGDGGGDECGIVVAGIAHCDCKVEKGGKRELHAFVMDDLSDSMTPGTWAEVIVNAYNSHEADRIVAEINNGGALVETNIRTVEGAENVAYEGVHAKKGKQARAEPVAALYEKGKVHHVGHWGKLEDEMTTWVPKSGLPSPNRLDALVWTLTALLLEEREEKTDAENWAEADPTDWAEVLGDLEIE